MKKLTGIIRKSKYSAVKKELIKLGITFFSILISIVIVTYQTHYR